MQGKKMIKCKCSGCVKGIVHTSDCAVHNMPAFPAGKCTCGADEKYKKNINKQKLSSKN